MVSSDEMVSSIITILVGFIVIVIGVILVPLLAGFINTAVADANVSAIAGLGEVLIIIAYVFVFAIIAVGVMVMVSGFKSIKG